MQQEIQRSGSAFQCAAKLLLESGGARVPGGLLRPMSGGRLRFFEAGNWLAWWSGVRWYSRQTLARVAGELSLPLFDGACIGGRRGGCAIGEG